MASSDAPPFASAFPADNEVEDARWLASLITALRAHAEQQGHPEVAAALDPALDVARAIVDGRTATERNAASAAVRIATPSG